MGYCLFGTRVLAVLQSKQTL
ncbi:hypothetical protein LINGRAHAP2_LOCUS36047 [Linum grandiflorum]